MSETRLRWGVLGAARIARHAVIPAIVQSRNGEVWALASRSVERARALAQQHGIPTVHDSYEAVVDDPQVQAVYIPLPNHLHKEWTLRAVRAGKHVLCEKPLALNAGEAQEMANAARQAGVLLMEAFMYRFHPRSRRVKALVEEGAIGDPRLVQATFCIGYVAPGDYRLRPEMGGGALLDVGCYAVSVSRWLLGAEPESVCADAEYGPTGIDLTLAGLLRMPEARLAVIASSFKTALQQTYTIAGSEGAIEVREDAFGPGAKETRLILRGLGGEERRVETFPPTDQYQLMVEHLADAALGREELAFPASEGVANMRVLDALTGAAREGDG
jgi:predicted dehydrogenase